MTPEEKVLFDKVNEILKCKAVAYKLPVTKSTKRTYLHEVEKFLKHLALNGKQSLEFTGFDIIDCIDSMIRQRIERDGVHYKYQIFETFRSALVWFNGVLTTYERHTTGNREIVDEIPYLKDADYHIQVIKNRNNKVRLKNYEDKATVEVAQAVYSHKNLVDMVHEGLAMTGRKSSSRQKTQVERSLKLRGINTALELLQGDKCLLRGANKRDLAISDATYQEQTTAFGTYPVLKFNINSEKTMKGTDITRSVGVVRHKDHRVCLVSIFALSLWFHFDFDDGLLQHGTRYFPDFTSKENWYDIRVLMATKSKPKEPISYSYELSIVREVLAEVGFHATKGTHLGRKNQAKTADANSVPVDQIGRAGHWANDVLRTHYLTNLPFEFIHLAAGFHNYERYFIPRAHYDVPDSLKDRIFPWLDTEALKHESKYHNPNVTFLPGQGDFAGEFFFEMLADFRDVILQDLVHWTELCPESIFAQHPITKDPEFLRFKEECLKMSDSDMLKDTWKTPSDAIDGICPHMTSKFDTLLARNMMGFQEVLSAVGMLQKNNAMLQRSNEILVKQVTELQQQTMALNSQIASLHHTVIRKPCAVQRDNVKHAEPHENMAVGPSSNKANPSATQITSGSEADDVNDLKDVEDRETEVTEIKLAIKVGLREALRGYNLNTSESPDDEEPLPMKRNIKTMSEAIQEWYYDDGDVLSVEKRDKTMGNSWRLSIIRFYKRRKRLITFINELKKIDHFKLMSRRSWRHYAIDTYN